MKINRRVLLFIICCLISVAAGCKGEVLSPPPPPSLTSTSPAGTAVPSSTAPPETGPVTGATITRNEVVISFPDSIVFMLDGKSVSPVTEVTLEYRTDERSLVPEINKIKPDFTEGTDVAASWSWEMKKTGSIPPGVTIWWQWKLKDSAGNTDIVPERSITYEDTRFQWQVNQLANMDLNWTGQSQSLKQELTSELESKLARHQLDVVIPPERKPNIFIYSNSEQLRGAVLYEHEWTGALAYPSYNIILTAVDNDNLEWAKSALPHEITHLMVGEVLFGPFGDIPVWLNEGLAEYGGGPLDEESREFLARAFRDGTLISLRSLSSGFPVDAQQAYLSYAESASVVTYLLDIYGWEKMRQLLRIYKEGSSFDNAFLETYSLDINGVEAAWKSYLGET